MMNAPKENIYLNQNWINPSLNQIGFHQNLIGYTYIHLSLDLNAQFSHQVLLSEMSLNKKWIFLPPLP